MRGISTNVVLCFLSSIIVIGATHGTGFIGILGIFFFFFLEFFYLYRFIGFIKKSKARKNLFLLISAIGIITYALLFPVINNLELWFDEIVAIMSSSIPLDKISNYVMTQHYAVAPLEFWNLWLWIKVPQLFPIQYQEFIYRIPYMVYHILATIIFSITLSEYSNTKKSPLNNWILILFIGLYFFNPMLLVFSYEMRFYEMAFLGLTIFLYLHTKSKLFQLSNYPLVSIFCLNSTIQFVILAPFILFELYIKKTRKQALVFLLYLLPLVLSVIIPYLIQSKSTAANTWTINSNSLNNLVCMFFDSSLKQAVVIIILLFSLLKKPKTVLLLFAYCAIYLAFMVGLNSVFQYTYFNTKHLMYVIPICIFIAYVFVYIFKNKIYKICASFLICYLFFNPYYSHIKRITQNQFAVKDIFPWKKIHQDTLQYNINTLLVSYGNQSNDLIKYYRVSLLWYKKYYNNVKIIESTDTNICEIFNKDRSAMIFYIYNQQECIYEHQTVKESLHNSLLVRKYND